MPQFRKIIEEAEAYKVKLEGKWREDESIVGEYFKEIFGQEMNSAVDVYVVPPQYSAGETHFNNSGNFIVWGSDKTNEDNHYDTVYLAHEILHATYMQYPDFPKDLEREQRKQKRDNIHSAIQYLADKELNHRLTGQSYLTNPSHPFLIETMKKMYPYFLGYLYRNEEKADEKVRTALLRDYNYRASQTETGKGSELAYVKFEQLSPKKIAKFFKDKSNMSIEEFLEIDFENGEKEFGLDSWELPINFEPATVPVNNGEEQNRQQEQEQR